MNCFLSKDFFCDIKWDFRVGKRVYQLTLEDAYRNFYQKQLLKMCQEPKGRTEQLLAKTSDTLFIGNTKDDMISMWRAKLDPTEHLAPETRDTIHELIFQLWHYCSGKDKDSMTVEMCALFDDYVLKARKDLDPYYEIIFQAISAFCNWRFSEEIADRIVIADFLDLLTYKSNRLMYLLPVEVQQVCISVRLNNTDKIGHGKIIDTLTSIFLSYHRENPQWVEWIFVFVLIKMASLNQLPKKEQTDYFNCDLSKFTNRSKDPAKNVAHLRKIVGKMIKLYVEFMTIYERGSLCVKEPDRRIFLTFNPCTSVFDSVVENFDDNNKYYSVLSKIMVQVLITREHIAPYEHQERMAHFARILRMERRFKRIKK
jgi:hypothetical protein